MKCEHTMSKYMSQIILGKCVKVGWRKHFTKPIFSTMIIFPTYSVDNCIHVDTDMDLVFCSNAKKKPQPIQLARDVVSLCFRFAPQFASDGTNLGHWLCLTAGRREARRPCALPTSPHLARIQSADNALPRSVVSCDFSPAAWWGSLDSFFSKLVFFLMNTNLFIFIFILLYGFLCSTKSDPCLWFRFGFNHIVCSMAWANQSLFQWM